MDSSRSSGHLRLTPLHPSLPAISHPTLSLHFISHTGGGCGHSHLPVHTVPEFISHTLSPGGGAGQYGKGVETLHRETPGGRYKRPMQTAVATNPPSSTAIDAAKRSILSIDLPPETPPFGRARQQIAPRASPFPAVTTVPLSFVLCYPVSRLAPIRESLSRDWESTTVRTIRRLYRRSAT